ncbi:hypothetical protein M011DRAFT_463680 [Sporormia fimetaria CBS 119925]|uniref:SPIN90/Ldb17 leucine-rich domain-containing protein n=1 Tax=Sporormia fimetaria CBS 119925 TaxID=1340428 RepID=A0A6A6VRL8_9PLEO|nr:hypothetical protein M011DRAFT_463680 [Sporormia fimetaria CBS 119925]
MAFEVSYNLENEQQFWDELNDIVSTDCHEDGLIDNALRAFLNVTTTYIADYLQTEYSLAKCVHQFTHGELFTAHSEYVRRQMMYCLLQDDEPPVLLMTAAFLLYDGRNNGHDLTFEMMQTEGVFARLVELIRAPNVRQETRLHQMLLELMYESSRIQRLRVEDLLAVDDSFILYLLDIIEGVSDDPDDPYHYNVIRVLLVLNEQYLVISTTQQASGRAGITNRVIKALSAHGLTYKTFGCNLILLLNRESETSLQLLILKALYLLFGNPSTAEYFYTNDLHVLIDVILRNLIDLPADSPGANALRHTYLRVLHPLLANSQISKPPHYKRDDILRLLHLLVTNGNHFAPVDETTERLVARCTSVPWLQPPSAASNKTTKSNGKAPPIPPPRAGSRGSQKDVARRALGMSVNAGGESLTSVLEVAAHTEKPGVQTPSLLNPKQNAPKETSSDS